MVSVDINPYISILVESSLDCVSEELGGGAVLSLVNLTVSLDVKHHVTTTTQATGTSADVESHIGAVNLRLLNSAYTTKYKAVSLNSI